MAINRYFQNGTRQEQNLYENLIIEAIKIYGQDFYYIPRKIVKRDLVLNEDLISEFEKALKIEMYLESVDGYEGDGQLLSKFGLEARDAITLVVSNLRWNQLVGKYGYAANSVRPTEGDLIYFPMMNHLFEITFVEDKKPFRQLKDFPIFRLSCHLFEYESQKLNTGVAAIDKLETIDGDALVFTYGNNTGSFIPGETIAFTLPAGPFGSGGTGGSFEYFSSSLDTNVSPSTLIMRASIPTFNDGAFHEIVAGTLMVGQKSGAIGEILSIPSLANGTATDQTIFVNDQFAQNATFNTAVNAGNFLDFSEANPFGEPFSF
jgi:hypothetical protein